MFPAYWNSYTCDADSELSVRERRQSRSRKKRKRVGAVKQADTEEIYQGPFEDLVMNDEVPYQDDDEYLVEPDVDGEEGNFSEQLPMTSSEESSWEVSDFASTDDSADESMP